MIRILLCASSPVTLAGLESVLAAEPLFEIAGRCTSLTAADDDIERIHPDVVVAALDEDIEPALTQLSALSNHVRSPAVVALISKTDGSYPAELLRAGASAVLPQDVAAEEVRAAIQAAAARLISIHADFVGGLVTGVPLRSFDGAVAQLTARERDVLQMMADGLGNKTIARRLGISMHTVKFHVGSIMSKLHAASRTEAVTLGIRQGLILL